MKGCIAGLMLLCLATSSFSMVLKEDLTQYASPVNETITQYVKSENESSTSQVSTQSTTPSQKPTSPASTSSESTSATPLTTISTVTPKTTASTAPSTTASSTTTSLPTSSTTVPIPSSSSTTSKPTTTPSTSSTSTTTAAPLPTSSTTAPIPSSTPSPAPNKTLPGEWIVKDSTTNVTCVVMKMNLNVTVKYPTINNKSETIVIAPALSNPNGTVVNGTCNNLTQSIVIPLTFGFAKFDFSLNTTQSTLSAIAVNVSGLPQFAGNGSLLFNETVPLWVLPVTMSYKCSKVQNISMISGDNSTAAFIYVSEAQIQAFRKDNTTKFADAQDCEAVETPDLVPIAVGVSLGVMIVVVLVAYLIGRRRSQSRGYVSM